MGDFPDFLVVFSLLLRKQDLFLITCEFYFTFHQEVSVEYVKVYRNTIYTISPDFIPLLLLFIERRLPSKLPMYMMNETSSMFRLKISSSC